MMGEDKQNDKLFANVGGEIKELRIEEISHGFAEDLVDNAEITTYLNDNGGLDITFEFDESLVRNTFSWKLLFGSNNWRKLHGINMRRKKCLR